MRTLKQIFAVTWLNIRNLPRRLAPSVVAVVGVAAVVLVFSAVLSMAKGFERTMIAAGSEDTAIVMRSGATAELNSGLSNEQALIVGNAPGVLTVDGKPLVSAELYVIVDVTKRSNNAEANVPFRGVQAAAFQVRDNVEIVEGRMFETGKNELVVGRAAQQEFMGLDIGQTIRFGQSEWEVVGIFEADGSVSESELWTDVTVLQGAYRRGNSFQSVRAQLTSPAALQTLEDGLGADPRVSVSVRSEQQFYSEQSALLRGMVTTIGVLIAVLMGAGAVFAALNTMYSAVAARTREIATLRALGFGALPVVLSVLAEALLLGLVGGVIGGLIAYFGFNGYQANTLNWASFSQITFAFTITPKLLVTGIAYALLLALIGGLLPGIRAARMPVTAGLREL